MGPVMKENGTKVLFMVMEYIKKYKVMSIEASGNMDFDMVKVN